MLESDEPYAGMNKLYCIVLKRTDQKKVVVLSGMPNWFEGRIETFLKTQGFPESELKLRNVFWHWSITNFKMKELDEILKDNPEGVVLVLDDSSASQSFFQKALEKYGSKILTTYMRQVSKQQLPSGVVPFFTTFDIALSELKSGRLSRRDLEQVLIDVVTEPIDQRLIPEYAFCPENYNPCADQIAVNCQRLVERIQKICAGRSKLP